MRRLCLLAALFFAATAAAATAVAAPGGEVDARSRALLRSIRAQAANPAKGTDELRRALDELAARPDADAVAARLERARDYLSRIEDGRPLPPPEPDELDSSDAPDALEELEARSAAAAASQEARVSELASALAVSGAARAFDGARARGVAAPVEYEPAHGYHTVNADALLSATGKDRDDKLKRMVDELLAKAGFADKGGKRAKQLVALLAARLDAHPQRRRMRALRLRVLPNGRMALFYRLDDAFVIEEALEFGLLPDAPAKGRKIAKGKKKSKKKGKKADADSAGGATSGGGKKAKVPGAPDFGGGGGAGGVGAAGRGAGRGKSGRSVLSEDAAEGRSAAIMPLGPSARVDPDGARTSGRRGAQAKTAAAPGGRSAASPRAEGRGVVGADGGSSGGSGRRRSEKEGGKDAKGPKDALAGIPELPHLSGDRPRGRLGGDKPAASASSTAAAAIAAAPAANRAPDSSAASSSPALDAPSAAPESELRDAVAADAVAVPAPGASGGLTTPGSDAPAPAPATDRAGASAALFTASAALGAVGLLLSRRG